MICLIGLIRLIHARRKKIFFESIVFTLLYKYAIHPRADTFKNFKLCISTKLSDLLDQNYRTVVYINKFYLYPSM